MARRMLGPMTSATGTRDGDAWRRLRCLPRDDVTVTDLGDQLVLLDPRNQEMFALDAVGRFIWGALPGGDFGEVAAALAERYGLDLATAERDLHDLVAELAEAGLVRVSAHAEPPA
jgi:hypothetical protein